MKNVNWMGGAKKRMRNLSKEGGSSFISCIENKKQIYQNPDAENETLFLRLYNKNELVLKESKEFKNSNNEIPTNMEVRSEKLIIKGDDMKINQTELPILRIQTIERKQDKFLLRTE